ncbi:uncharacterized protein LOC128549667 [Mercenaria mercenaria]|uniref:uncharacterized protein LOC128549667 n=1 Tax=Mercenaria mercenaria TaxID=6596 RepID=UPI00234EBB58|nr:uncharacterized protein LOC128549667 [Mercenaria mercenaria]
MEKYEEMLDIAFAMDCTASMGIYIAVARENIIQIVRDIKQRRQCDVRLALVEYRDHPPADETFITRTHDFTHIPGEMRKWLYACDAAGGGDLPEAVADALQEILLLSWREDATKICVFITDAPPHGLGTFADKFPGGCPDGLDPLVICQALAKAGIAVYVAGCEPSICAYKDFYLALTHITGGQYVPMEKSDSLVKLITYGAIEELSLRKFENEVDEIVRAQIIKGRALDEEYVARQLHIQITKRGEKVSQLQMNKKELASAMSSKFARSLTTMKSFSEIQDVYKLPKELRLSAIKDLQLSVPDSDRLSVAGDSDTVSLNTTQTPDSARYSLAGDEYRSSDSLSPGTDKLVDKKVKRTVSKTKGLRGVLPPLEELMTSSRPGSADLPTRRCGVDGVLRPKSSDGAKHVTKSTADKTPSVDKGNDLESVEANLSLSQSVRLVQRSLQKFK